jgi:tetratricopeptide (TPR) repeat protein
LAAARVRTFTVEQIARRLDDAFRLLTGGSRTALPRQQTLRATLDWSYNLLTDPERALLRALSVFAGGWTVEAAEAVHGADADADADTAGWLDQLVNKSWVGAEERPAGMRYTMLETVRQYAHEKLVSAGEEGLTHGRHLAYYAGLANAAESHFVGGLEERRWHTRLAADVDNLRAALSWAAATGDWRSVLGGDADVESLGAWSSETLLFRLLLELLLDHGYRRDVQQWLDAAILSNPDVDDRARWFGLQLMGVLLIYTGDVSGAMAWWRKSGEQAYRLENEELIAYSDSLIGLVTPDYGQARALLERVIQWAQQAGRKRPEAFAACVLGGRMGLHGEYERATAMLERGLELGYETGHRPVINQALWRLGQVWLERGDYARAHTLLAECVAMIRDMPLSHQLTPLVDLGTASLYRGDVAQARDAIREFIPFAYGMDNLERVAQGLVLAAGVAQAVGKLPEAARLLGAAAAIRRDHHTHGFGERELFAEYDRRLPAVREAMAPADFERAWAEGQMLTLREAIAEALAL